MASLALAVAATADAEVPGTIDRRALVERHAPQATGFDPFSPFSVGNGGFAVTVDATGLQGFPDAYDGGVPLGTMADWGWAAPDNPGGYRLEDSFELFDSGGRSVPYPTDVSAPGALWLRSNPHRVDLGRLAFDFRDARGRALAPGDFGEMRQHLDLWHGSVESAFEVDGMPVRVRTAVTPRTLGDTLTIEITTPLLSREDLALQLFFPAPDAAWGPRVGPRQPGAHATRPIKGEDGLPRIRRSVPGLEYDVRIRPMDDSHVALSQPHEHRVRLRLISGGAETVRLSLDFAPVGHRMGQADALEASARHWPEFWRSGGAVDFSDSDDPRASELERRVVLSQYLTAIQCAGTMPPQETGLTLNSWHGVSHLEMAWWHGVHFALWGRGERIGLVPGSTGWLDWYGGIQSVAETIARRQGYAGMRWPKMVDARGIEKPSEIAPLLLWQQPHLIYFAELAWRARPGPETLRRYDTWVGASAAFMADVPVPAPDGGALDLGPPLMPAQERFDARTTRNAPFELAYWRWGLETAQAWRERSGLERHAEWDRVIAQLAPYPIDGGTYASAAGQWVNDDHPAVLAAFGMLPGHGVDPERMRATLTRVLREQNWEDTWGWDYPLIAMSAARLGQAELAADALLMDRLKNRYLPNGHNFQSADALPVYLPGNGALLAAVAMMAAGWDGAPDQPAPGFPVDGWRVRHEGLHRLP